MNQDPESTKINMLLTQVAYTVYLYSIQKQVVKCQSMFIPSYISDFLAYCTICNKDIPKFTLDVV